MRPTELLDLLAVPGTDEALALVVSGYAGNEPYSGWLEDRDGKVWARLNAFRFRFVEFDPVSDAERHRVATEGPKEILVPTSTYTSSLDDRCRWTGHTIERGDYLKGFDGSDASAGMVIESEATKIELLFNAHGWSGVAAITVNDILTTRVDLFNEANDITRRVGIDNPDKGSMTIRIHPDGHNPESQGRELLVDGFVEYFDELVTPTYSKSVERNRGGDFRDRFFEVAAALASDAVILDVGGGRRQLADQRYLNLDYSSFEEPDLFGDATRLPFKSNCIDFVYTAAVLEHVRDPLSMGREIHRVLKPAGVVLAASAFMQPVHSEGQHFFNLTPYGIDLTFEMFEERKVWWDTAFAYTIRWLVEVAQLRASISGEKVDKFVELADEFSPLISDQRGMYLAAAVWLEAKK